MATKLKHSIVSAFKMHGLTLRSDASRYLAEVLLPVAESQQEWLEKILEYVQKQPLKSSMIDRSVCEAAVEECNDDQEDDSDKVFSVIDAFNVPRFKYNAHRKKFLVDTSVPSVHSDADTKADMLRERHNILLQRTCRHELFTPSAVGAQLSDESKKFQLKPVEYLLGSSAKLGNVIVLGMLTQLKEGKWFLEDTTGAVQLQLSKANFHTGLFTENCFVLAEGNYEDDVFHVNALGFPPAEQEKTTRAYFGNINFFGGDHATSVKGSVRLKQLEEENEDAMFVILSDVWLDHSKVMEKLRVLFTGYAEMPPTCFIFCGNFTSKPYGMKHAKVLKACFRSLADLLCEFQQLTKRSQFLFVPGPQDSALSQILPRPALPRCVTDELSERLPSAIFCSNPCRVQYCTQQIVVFREDIIMKMCRNCVRFPTDGAIASHFAKTVVCQGHLCSLPLHVAPLYWAHDVAMRLYPLPDVVICADKYEPFTNEHANCLVSNPGSFPRSSFSFKVYYPASRTIEDSRIDT